MRLRLIAPLWMVVAQVCLAQSVELDNGAQISMTNASQVTTVDFKTAGGLFTMSSSSALLQIGGNWTDTSPGGSISLTNGTVEYDAASGTQNLATETYYNLTLDGGATSAVTGALASGTTTVSGVCLIQTSASNITLQFGAGQNMTVNGTFRTRPGTKTITVTGLVSGNTNLNLLGCIVDVLGMTYKNASATGLTIGQNGGTDCTVTSFSNVTFTNASAGGRHLYYKAAGGISMVGVGCSFDNSFGAGKNVKCDSSTGTPPYAVCVMARATGAGSGAAFDDDADGGTGTGYVTWTYGGDQVTTTPGSGENSSDSAGTPAPLTYTGVQGFMTSQYNWYNGYFIDNYLLARQGTSGAGNDLLVAMDNYGAIRGSMSLSQAAVGNVIGPPWTATLGAAPGSAEVIIFVTTKGWIYVVQDFTTTLSSAVPAGSADLPVNSTAGFPASGTLLLGSGSSQNTVTYGSVDATNFKGCSAYGAQGIGTQVSLASGGGMLQNYGVFPKQPWSSSGAGYAPVVCQAAYSPLLFDAGADGVANKAGDADDFFYFTGCDTAPGGANYNVASHNQVIRTTCFTGGSEAKCVSGFPFAYNASAAWNWPVLQVLDSTHTYLHIGTDCDVYTSPEASTNQAHIFRVWVNGTPAVIDQEYVSAGGTHRPRNHLRGGMQIVTDFVNPNYNYLYAGSYHDTAAAADHAKFYSINTTTSAAGAYADQWTPFSDATNNDIDSMATFGSTQIFFGDSGGLLHSINNTTGLETAGWPVTLDAGKAIRCAAVFPTAGTSNLYIGNDYGEVFEVNTNTGAIVNTYRLGDGQPGGVTRRVRTLSLFIDNSNNTYVGAITSDGYEFLLGPF